MGRIDEAEAERIVINGKPGPAAGNERGRLRQTGNGRLQTGTGISDFNPSHQHPCRNGYTQEYGNNRHDHPQLSDLIALAPFSVTFHDFFFSAAHGFLPSSYSLTFFIAIVLRI
jgi:hypothetical protein